MIYTITWWSFHVTRHGKARTYREIVDHGTRTRRDVFFDRDVRQMSQDIRVVVDQDATKVSGHSIDSTSIFHLLQRDRAFILIRYHDSSEKIIVSMFGRSIRVSRKGDNVNVQICYLVSVSSDRWQKLRGRKKDTIYLMSRKIWYLQMYRCMISKTVDYHIGTRCRNSSKSNFLKLTRI